MEITDFVVQGYGESLEVGVRTIKVTDEGIEMRIEWEVEEEVEEE